MIFNKKQILIPGGFTLIELMVSIAVVGIISSMVLVSFRGVDKRNKVDLAAYKLASDIRRAQSFALSMKEFANTNPANSVPDRGWGIYFHKVSPDNKLYKIFADGDNVISGKDDCKFDDDELYEEIKIINDVFIKDMKINGGGNPQNIFIVFEPPNPNMYICYQNPNSCTAASCTNNNTAEITLSDLTDTYQKKVLVNKFGLVDVN